MYQNHYNGTHTKHVSDTFVKLQVMRATTSIIRVISVVPGPCVWKALMGPIPLGIWPTLEIRARSVQMMNTYQNGVVVQLGAALKCGMSRTSDLPDF